MDPALDGTGGGFGKNRGLLVKDLAMTLDRFAADGTMRSVTGILRLAREQLEARGGLGVYPPLAIGVTVLTLGIGGAMLAVPPERTGAVQPFLFATASMAAALWVGVAMSGQARRRALAQETEIRRLAVDALRRVVLTPGFHSKRLDRQDRITLRDLLVKTRTRVPELAELLRDSE